jgi:hypothetical protein
MGGARLETAVDASKLAGWHRNSVPGTYGGAAMTGRDTSKGQGKPSSRKRGHGKGKTAAKRDGAPAASQAPALRNPTEQEQRRIAVAKQRLDQRRPPPEVRTRALDGAALGLSAGHSDAYGNQAHLLDTFGTASHAFVDLMLLQLVQTARADQKTPLTDNQLNGALAIVHGIAPRDETEAMLAVQMAGTHMTAMTMLHKAQCAQTVEGIREFGNLATKLQRTFTAQMEGLGKLRRGGEQKVRVEHVNVYPGGQAVVGHVSANGRGEGGFDGNGRHPQGLDAPALAYAPGASVWSTDPEGNAVPVAGGEGQEAMPDARRGEGQRRAKRGA